MEAELVLTSEQKDILEMLMQNDTSKVYQTDGKVILLDRNNKSDIDWYYDR